MALPMHRKRVVTQHLHAVHADIADAGRWVAGDDTAEGDVGAAVLGPADRHRELREIDVRVPQDRVLTGRPADALGGELGELGDTGQHRESAEQTLLHLHIKYM